MNEIELEYTSIHTLRTIAREMGVKAPTSLRKHELIGAIIRIDKGIDKPCRSNKGRPNIDTEINYEKKIPYNLSKKEEEIIKKFNILLDIKTELKKLKQLITELLED